MIRSLGERATNAINQPHPRLYYGWVILAVSFTTLFMAYAVWYSFSVFFVAMFEEFGWSRASTAGVFSTNQLVYGAAAPLSGLLMDRWGPRIVIPLGAAILALALAASSQIDSLWQFYLLFGVLSALGVNLCGTLPNMAVVQQWFVRRRGLAIGFVAMGIGTGMMVMVPIAQYLVSTLGWRTTYLVLAALTFFTIAPLAGIMQRFRPQDMGLEPDGPSRSGQSAVAAKAAAERMIVDRAWATRDWTVRRALGTWRFWLIWIGVAGAPFTTQMILVHQVAFLVDVGYDKMFAAFALSAAGGLGTPCRLFWGYLSDRLGREHAYALAAALTIVGIILLLAAVALKAPLLIWGYAAFFGAGYGANAVIFPAVASDLFQGRHFGTIFGLLYIGMGVGGAIGTWLGGYGHDVTGSYFLPFTWAMFTMAIAALSYWVCSPRKVRLVAGRLK